MLRQWEGLMRASKSEFSRHRSLLEFLNFAGCGMASKSRL